MKKTIQTLLAILTLTACGNTDQEFDIKGMWVLHCIHVADGSGYHYQYDPQTGIQPMKVFADSTYYVAQKVSEPGVLQFRPSYSGRYKLISKGGLEWLYLEDGNVHRFSVVDDSIITIDDVGRTYEWHRMDKSASPYADDIMAVINRGRDSWDDDSSTYVFTEAERSLKSENHNLTAVVMCVVLAFVLLAYFTRNIYRNKARAEAQLKQIREEIDARPQVVQEAMKSVEDEFLHSDFYMSIRKRIMAGERLKKADWDEIEQHVNATYPGFTSRLFNLYPMSQTEMQTCLLIKLRVPTTEIASVLSKDTSSISSMRSRLYGKVFHEKGGAKEWNEFILSL